MANCDFFRRLGLADEVAAPTLGRTQATQDPAPSPPGAWHIIVLAGGLFAYTAGGRYVTTDNAYVHSGKLTVATDVHRARRSSSSTTCVLRSASFLAAT